MASPVGSLFVIAAAALPTISFGLLLALALPLLIHLLAQVAASLQAAGAGRVGVIVVAVADSTDCRGRCKVPGVVLLLLLLLLMGGMGTVGGRQAGRGGRCNCDSGGRWRFAIRGRFPNPATPPQNVLYSPKKYTMGFGCQVW